MFEFWEVEPKFERELHVDCNNPLASDDNDGSAERPFNTINVAAQVDTPGTRILIHGGVYRETVRPDQGWPKSRETKGNKLLYYNRSLMYVTVKTMMAINEFYDASYDEVHMCEDEKVVAESVLAVSSGSEFLFDVYETTDRGFKVSDDLGFSTKISLVMAESDNPRDYYCFAPGAWYKQNEFAPDRIIGKDLDCEYFWQMETRFALPLFAMQNISSG